MWPNHVELFTCIDNYYCTSQGASSSGGGLAVRTPMGHPNPWTGRFMWNPTVGVQALLDMPCMGPLRELIDHCHEAFEGMHNLRTHGKFGKGPIMLDSGDCFSETPWATRCTSSPWHKDFDNGMYTSFAMVRACVCACVCTHCLCVAR